MKGGGPFFGGLVRELSCSFLLCVGQGGGIGKTRDLANSEAF